MEAIERELVRHITADLVHLLAEWRHLVHPPIGSRQSRAEFVVVRVAYRIVAIAAINDRVLESTDAVWGILWTLLVAVEILD